MAEARRPAALAHHAPGAHFLIVEARYYDAVGAQLLEGALAALKAAGAKAHHINMPGALEIPPAIAIALDVAEAMGRPYQGVIALGCIIRGETYHFEIVANESARALMDLSVSRKIPLGNGILTVENIGQANERADPHRGDKGGDAARAALCVHSLKQSLGV